MAAAFLAAASPLPKTIVVGRAGHGFGCFSDRFPSLAPQSRH